MPDKKTESVTLLAEETITGSGATTGKNVSAYNELNLYIDVTAAGSSLDITIQDSPDGDTYYDLASVDQITATGQYAHRVSGNIGEWIRLSYTANGNWTLSAVGVLKT